jgi:predicted  nucleic acid-binding Zn-ribbon protein
MAELKGQVKLWATQTKIASQTDVRILLTKVDAAFNQIAHLERSLVDAQKQIKSLSAGKENLQAQMGQMVPLSDLHAAKAETSKLRETNDALHQQLRSVQSEVEKLTSTIQGMASRSDLLAALAETKAMKEELAAKGKELVWMEGQVSKGQEQLNSARLEGAQLQAAISGMVPRSDLDVMKRQLNEVEASARADGQAQRDQITSLNERLQALEDEKSQMVLKMQVIDIKSY